MKLITKQLGNKFNPSYIAQRIMQKRLDYFSKTEQPTILSGITGVIISIKFS